MNQSSAVDPNHFMKQNRKQINEFWQQVEQTIDLLLHSQQESHFEADMLLNQYSDILREIDQNLTFHFERDEDEGPVEMIFGCDGYPESISMVLSLVGAAPQLHGIQFKAFNHRYDPVPGFINVGDEYCELSDYCFALRLVDGKLHLEIYMEDAPTELELDPRVEAVMIFLDALIGEYELMTRIWSLDWLERPVDPRDYGLRPLSELRAAFDRDKAAVAPIGMTMH